MTTADSIIGTLSVSWKGLVCPTDEQVQQLEQMAGMISLAMDRLQIVEEGRLRIKELEAMREVGHAINSSLALEDVYVTFASEAAKLINCDEIRIAIADIDAYTVTNVYVTGDVQHGVPENSSRSLRGTMLEASINAGQSSYVSGESAEAMTESFEGLKPHAKLGARSTLTVPLYSDGKVIASVGFTSLDANAFSEADVDIVEMLGAHLAGAIANAQLFAKHEEATEELRTTASGLQAVVNNAPIIISAIDNNGVYTLSEGKGLESRGLQPGELVGQSVYTRNISDPKVMDNIERTLRGERVSDQY